MKNTQKEYLKRMIVSEIKIKIQFSYAVSAKYEHRTAADNHLIYNTNVHKNRSVLLALMWLNSWCYETLTCLKGGE